MHLCAYDTMLLLHGHMFSGLGGGLKCPTLQFMMHTAVILSSLKYSSAQTIFSLCSRSFYSFPLPKEKILSVTAKRPHVPLKYFLFYLGDHVPCSRTLMSHVVKMCPSLFPGLALGTDLQVFTISVPSAYEALLHTHLLTPKFWHLRPS